MHDDHNVSPGGRRDEDPDLDAEFAAIVEGLELPVQPDVDGESVAGGPDAPTEQDGPVSPRDVPHNVYGERGGADSKGEERLTPEQLAELEAFTSALGSDSGTAGGPRAVKIALVLTPLASAEALAALCAASGLECTVVPTASGAVAVKEFVSAHAEWDIAELLGGADTEPAEAAELAGVLSRLSRAGVVLVTADLATDAGVESGLSGTITVRHYRNGAAGEEISPGVLLPDLDESIEDILFGATRVQDVPGAIRTTEVKPGRIMRWLGRGMRPRGSGGGSEAD
ncbi:hypothetical protein [Actinomyces sp.]|uniref:hypothetical protein n=1 Tax=Actinomyces sp. TaxID=29317 RepID=UPI0026DB8D91|nr:hypothetical protein [Actinomyces sp.]MDO4899628.1 hypothetical protein [Actinomyces sp.]